MNIGIFCSANDHIDPDFFQLTRELGRWIALQGHTIVYGGAHFGLMRCIAEAAREAGGRVVGVVPAILEANGRMSPFLDEVIRCDSLNERILLMTRLSDVFIALPGGIGTLDEVFSVAASHTIGYHQKPLILYNMKGFWDGVVRMLDDLQSKGVIRQHWSQYILVADTLDAIVHHDPFFARGKQTSQ